VAVIAGDGNSPHSPSLRLGLPAPQPSRDHHAQSLLGPSFHDPRTHHVLGSHPERATPLSRHDDERRHAVCFHSALALRLHLAACNPSSGCRFWLSESWTTSAPICLNRFAFAESRKPDIWTHVLVFTFFSSAFAFLVEVNFSFTSLFAIWSLSPQRFHYYFYLSIISWQYQKYSTTLILALCLLSVTVCSSYSSFAPSSPFFRSWWQKDCELFTHTLVLQCAPLTSSCQPKTTQFFWREYIHIL